MALSFNQLDVGFLSSFLPKELGISRFDALLSGNIQIKGNITKPNFTGNLNIDEGSFYLKLSNLLYKVQGNIILRDYQLFFKNIQY